MVYTFSGLDALAQKSRHELLSECQTNRASVAVFSPGQHESMLTVAPSAHRENMAAVANKQQETADRMFGLVTFMRIL